MKTIVAPSRTRFGLWSLLLTGFLVATLVLGFQASRGSVDPNLHAMAGFVVAGLAVVSHVRYGSGWDLLAVLTLLGAVALGLGVQGGGVAADFHLALSLPAVVLSGMLHLRRWRS